MHLFQGHTELDTDTSETLEDKISYRGQRKYYVLCVTVRRSGWRPRLKFNAPKNLKQYDPKESDGVSKVEYWCNVSHVSLPIAFLSTYKL